MSLNVEGLTSEKELIISHIVRTNSIDVLCLQETHRDEYHRKPTINGLKLIAEHHHNKYGSAVFVKNSIDVVSTHSTCVNNIEIITIDIGNITISSIYKPPNVDFEFNEPVNFQNHKSKIVIGDFNNQSTQWGYQETNEDGVRVEDWADKQQLKLIHDPKLPKSFNSRRWKNGYNPDHIFVGENIEQLSAKRVIDPIPRTQHRPIICEISATIRPTIVPFQRRYNFKKAKWREYAMTLDRVIDTIQPTPEHYDDFVKIVKEVSKQHIPRGCRRYYIPGMKKELQKTLDEYIERYENDPFDDETIQVREAFLTDIAEERRKDWQKTVEEINMAQNSNKA